jgi:hypothetical protein
MESLISFAYKESITNFMDLATWMDICMMKLWKNWKLGSEKKNGLIFADGL